MSAPPESSPAQPDQREPSRAPSPARGAKARGAKARGAKARGAKARGEKARGEKNRGEKMSGARSGGAGLRLQLWTWAGALLVVCAGLLVSVHLAAPAPSPLGQPRYVHARAKWDDQVGSADIEHPASGRGSSVAPIPYPDGSPAASLERQSQPRKAETSPSGTSAADTPAAGTSAAHADDSLADDADADETAFDQAEVEAQLERARPQPRSAPDPR